MIVGTKIQNNVDVNNEIEKIFSFHADSFPASSDFQLRPASSDCKSDDTEYQLLCLQTLTIK